MPVSVQAQFRAVEAASIEVVVNGRSLRFVPDPLATPQTLPPDSASQLVVKVVAYDTAGTPVASVATTRATRPGEAAGIAVFTGPRRPPNGLCSSVIAAAVLQNGLGDSLFVSFGSTAPGAIC